MLMTIPGVLTPDELGQVRALVAEEAGEAGGDKHTRLQEICRAGLERNHRFRTATWAKHCGAPTISRQQPGTTHGDQIDEWRIDNHRTDVSVTLFISDPADYDGGALVISTPFGWQKVRLAAGSAVAFPATALYRVDPVTRGTRLALVIPVESLIRDERQREIMFDLVNMRQRLFQADANGDDARIINKTLTNLMRMWTE